MSRVTTSREGRGDADELFIEALTGEAIATPNPIPAPAREPGVAVDRRARPAVRSATQAPTFTIGSTAITAATVTDAGLYMIDGDRAVASQPITPQRVATTKQFLASARGGPSPEQYDRLVDALVLGGFPVRMWAALVAAFESGGTNRNGAFGFSGEELVRELTGPDAGDVRARLGAAGVRTWLQRAAESAGFAWNDGAAAALAAGARQIAEAAAAGTPTAFATAASASLAWSSLALLRAFPSPASRSEAATAIARLDHESRAALRFLSTTSIAAVQAKVRGNELSEPLQVQFDRIAERVRAVRRHLAAPLPNPYPGLSPW